MRDMTPEELEDWLAQAHSLYVSKIHHGEVAVTVACAELTTGCEYWDDCDQGSCLIDPDEIMHLGEDGTRQTRHGLVHRFDSAAMYWRVATGHCVTRMLKISEESEEQILRSSLLAGQSVPVLVEQVWEKYQARLRVVPESGSWLSL